MTKPKIILHCGAPKTGSTSFQHLLYANRAALIAAGIFVPEVSRKKRMKDDLRIMLAQLGRKPGPVPEKDIRHIRSVIDATAARHKASILLISNEGILGGPIRGRDGNADGAAKAVAKRGKAGRGPSGYPLAERMVKALALVLEGYDVEVRMVLRDYATFIPADYVQEVRMGETADFASFCRRHGADRFSFLPVARALRAAFGPHKVAFFDHADLVKDSHGVLSAAFPEIMAALGEAGRDVPRKNSTIGIGMVNAYRRWNRLVGKLPGSRTFRERIRQAGRRYVLLPFERLSRSPKVAFAPDVAARLSARYRTELAEIRGAGLADPAV